MNIDDWKSQIKRGTLEFCILLMIKQRPSYGYEIISTLEKYPILAAKENTLVGIGFLQSVLITVLQVFPDW